MNVLVDTSVWSLSLRRAPRDLNDGERRTVRELTELISEGRANLMGLIRQEVLSGIRSPAQFEKLRALLRSFIDVVIDTTDYESAAEASNRCRSKGVTVSVVDCLICAISTNRGWSVFAIDADFESIAEVLPLTLHKPRA